MNRYENHTEKIIVKIRFHLTQLIVVTALLDKLKRKYLITIDQLYLEWYT